MKKKIPEPTDEWPPMPKKDKSGRQFMMNLLEAFQDNKRVYFELEFIRGCTLLSQISTANQQVQKNANFYAAEVLLALNYLHE